MLRRFRKLFGSESRAGRRPRLLYRARPAVESLEDRTVPSTVSVTYSCSTNFLGTTTKFKSSVAINGQTPVSVTPGTAVSINQFYLDLTIPATFVTELRSAGVTWISGKIGAFNIKATDAKVAKVNVAGSGITIPKTLLPTSGAMTVRVPSGTEVLTVGSWTASQPGTMSFTTGALNYTLTTNLGFSFDVLCTPNPAKTISKTTVT